MSISEELYIPTPFPTLPTVFPTVLVRPWAAPPTVSVTPLRMPPGPLDCCLSADMVGLLACLIDWLDEVVDVMLDLMVIWIGVGMFWQLL